MASQPTNPPPAEEQGQGQGQGPAPAGLFGAGRAPPPPPAQPQEQGPAPAPGLFGAGVTVESEPVTRAPVEGFRIQKRKAEAGTNTARTRQRTQDAELTKALIEYQTFTTDATSKPQGKDFPGGAVMKTYNAHKAHPFVIFPQKAVDGIAAVASLFTDWKTWFNFDSQNPSLVLSRGDYQIHIRGALNFMDLKNDDGEGDFVFHKDEIAHKDLTGMNIMAKLSLGGHRLEQDDAQKILDFSQPRPGVDKNAPQVETGLHMLGFFVRKNKKVQVVYSGPQPQPDLIMATEVYNLVELLNKTAPIFVLLRQTRYVLSDVDANWCNRIRCVVRKGLLPFYKGIVRQANSFQFEDWIKNPEKHLAHQPWMRLKTQKPNGSFVEYASHPGKSFFSDMKEWETIISVALIHEIEYENMCSKATFGHTIEHEAQVIHNSGKYIQIAVSVKRYPKVPTPTFPPGSRFSISKGTTWVEKPAAGDDEEMADIDESLPINRRCWKAKSISKETNRSFVLSLVVDKHEQAEFKNGQIYNVTLEARRNVLPSRRQLKAIALVSQGRIDGPKTADIPYNNYLRSFILGKKLQPSPSRSPVEDLRPEDRELFDAYVATLPFTRPQQDFYDSVMKSRDNVNILQGPPGYGKTFEDASVGASFSIIGKRTGFFCPTNQGCEAAMDALIAERTKILSLDATKENKIKYIFFPMTTLCKAQLSSADEDIEGIVNDIVDDGDTTGKTDHRPYMLWTHIVNHQKIRGTDSWQSETERKSSKLWLETLEKIRNGEDVTKKAHRCFIKDAWKLAQSVICDPSTKVIVSTCNNAAVLKEMGFQPDLVIIDESASGTEADSTVPLSLFPDHIILSGDDKQLLPTVKCIHHAEYANQQGLSIFERALRNGNVPLFRLKINYRMHEEIAILLGAPSYGWLGCDESTAVEEDVQ